MARAPCHLELAKGQGDHPMPSEHAGCRADYGDQFQLCIDLLGQGKPGSFADFFEVTCPEPDGASTAGRLEVLECLTDEILHLLKTNLGLVDEDAAHGGALGSMFLVVAHRSGFALLVLQSQPPALETAHLYHWARRFYEKCLRVTLQSGHVHAALTTYLALGRVCEKLGSLEQAIEFYEKHRQLASREARMDDVDLADGRLTRAYRYTLPSAPLAPPTPWAGLTRSRWNSQLAGYLECSKPHQAVEALEQAMQAAIRTHDAKGEGCACAQAGYLQMRLHNYDVALSTLSACPYGGTASMYGRYHQRACSIASAAGDRKMEGEACVAIARCYDALADAGGAIRCLESLLDVTGTTDPVSEASAACSLGEHYFEEARYGDASRFVPSVGPVGVPER
eukprot:scaffold2280_cov430-Prasinococcus_capsulatus_cf.AAC.3